MNRIPVVLGLGVLTLALSLTGCFALNKRPQMREAIITPATLQPGESAVIKVKIDDRHDIVDRVVGVVKEDPRVKLNLHDDGVAPDVEADDDEWTIQVDVPFQAPPGSFTLLLTAFRSDGEVIVVRDRKAGDVPLSATATVEIQYPEGAEPVTAPVETPSPTETPAETPGEAPASPPPAEGAPAQQ